MEVLGLVLRQMVVGTVCLALLCKVEYVNPWCGGPGVCESVMWGLHKLRFPCIPSKIQQSLLFLSSLALEGPGGGRLEVYINTPYRIHGLGSTWRVRGTQ